MDKNKMIFFERRGGN